MPRRMRVGKPQRTCALYMLAGADAREKLRSGCPASCAWADMCWEGERVCGAYQVRCRRTSFGIHQERPLVKVDEGWAAACARRASQRPRPQHVRLPHLRAPSLNAPPPLHPPPSSCAHTLTARRTPCPRGAHAAPENTPGQRQQHAHTRTRTRAHAHKRPECEHARAQLMTCTWTGP